MQKILVTGGAGFIGSHLAAAFLQRGYDVRALDDLSKGNIGRIKRAELESGTERGIEFVKGDITSYDDCLRACRGVDAVSHHAAIPSVQDAMADPLRTNAINVTGTLNMLKAAVDSGVKLFIHASSIAVYGEPEVIPLPEHIPLKPESLYAASKIAGERYAEVFARSTGLKTVVFRYANVFGPDQDMDSDYSAVIPKFAIRVLNREPPIIYGDGRQTRDFIFVKDVARANIMALESDMAAGRTLNISTGAEVSIIDLVRTLGRVAGRDIEPVFEPARPGDVLRAASDNSLARKTLGFEPRYSLAQGIEAVLEWYGRDGQH